MEPKIISVSEYLDGINGDLKNHKAKIVGEVSGLQEYPGRNYLFFSIKDKADGSNIKCFMWKSDYRISGVTLSDGLEIIVSAYPSIYKPNGSISLQVESVELVGEGSLKIAYEKLKAKLSAEGLFDESRKREIPDFPHKIGVITSKSGAVINDFLTNIGKFGFEIIFVDSKVEGQDATKDLLSAVETLKKKDIDVLVIMRGGGSLESFLAFNNESLVRAVASFPVPTLTGIGHDKDIPLVSLVSDKNVSTPTAVASLLNQSWNEAESSLELSEEKIFGTFQNLLRDKQYILENSKVLIENKFNTLFETFKNAEVSISLSLGKIESQIFRISENISQKTKDLFFNFSLMSKTVFDMVGQAEKTIQNGNPERLLKRGYSIVKSNGKIVRKKDEVKSGDELDIIISDATIRATTN